MSVLTIGQQLGLFQEQINILKSLVSVEELAPDVYILKHPDLPEKNLHDREVPLSIFALVHGSESAGIGILNSFLRQLIQRPELIEFPLGIALGNPEAARAGKRYLEKDLNRSFASNDRSLKEPARAAELEKLLLKSWYFIDLHQTRMKNAEPFFIFPFNQKSFSFARQLAPTVPIVTHWSGGFSKEGRCSDEFHNLNGGVGLTIETGQNGLDPYQIGFGYFLLMQALEVVRKETGAEHNSQVSIPQDPFGAIYTWAATRVCHPEDKARLDSGWFNFRTLTEGEVVGSGKGGKLTAEASGKILFPKYPDPTVVSPSGPTELYRIIKEIRISDLPD